MPFFSKTTCRCYIIQSENLWAERAYCRGLIVSLIMYYVNVRQSAQALGLNCKFSDFKIGLIFRIYFKYTISSQPKYIYPLRIRFCSSNSSLVISPRANLSFSISRGVFPFFLLPTTLQIINMKAAINKIQRIIPIQCIPQK